jgi:hypothetical protein
MTTMEYQATTGPEVGTSIVEEMMTPVMGYITETEIEALTNTTEGTSHNMIQAGVVLLMRGVEECTMVAMRKVIMLEKELSVFMEGAEDSRSVPLQSRKRTESHNHG